MQSVSIDQVFRCIPSYTRVNRLHCFHKCVNALGIKSVGIPNQIGCGLGGGDWNDYFNIISEFSNRTKINVIIIILSFVSKIMEVAPSFTDDFRFLPVHPLMMYFTNREHTFQNWPTQLVQKPKDLIQNGFFILMLEIK